MDNGSSSINASIIDQRLTRVVDSIRERAGTELGIIDDTRLRSLAFVHLCVETMLDLEDESAFDCVTEGGGDFGVDAMHVSEEVDGEFAVTLFQGKYKKKLDATSSFPVNGIETLIRAVRHLFDPSSALGNVNPRLEAKVEDARSMVRDGFIPKVRVIACNNGLRWSADGEDAIARSGFGEQVTWEHVNHDVLVRMLQRTRSVSDTLRLSGKAVMEDMNFSRVCVGRMPVEEVAKIMRAHGDRLLERNIRRYLGLHGNRVNEGIRRTLLSGDSSNFYFFNNGLTIVCSDFSYNALQAGDFQVKVEDLQIVNGGQTCMTILKVENELERTGRTLPSDASVLVRIYKLPRDNEDLVLRITQATNSQNPVDLKDLRANDERQRLLEESVRGLGYAYRRKRTEVATGTSEFTSGTAAEAVLAVWRAAPHQARFYRREHFGKLYDTIFGLGLNGAQTIVAVLLFRIADARRRRPRADDPAFVRYAAHFVAMQMGKRLLRDLALSSVGGLTHQNFEQAESLIRESGDAYHQAALDDIAEALESLYGRRDLSLQQLSATFRRGDLISNLAQGELFGDPHAT